MRRLALLLLLTPVVVLVPSVAGAHVLRVGRFHGIRGQYRTVQAAVDAAKPGDWILIGPGDYKTHSGRIPKTVHPAATFPAGILITTPRLRLRGMNRNRVIVDGTRRGPACNHVKANQNFGPKTKNGPAGLNGIMVWKADDVWVQNMTACNFLGGSGEAGNEFWWNGGADSGGATKVKIGGWGFYGSYLTATSTWYDAGNGSQAAAAKAEVSAAEYGIFSSNWNGGTWDHTYASNFNDSGYYIGACGQQCNQTINHAWAQWNALGYSGSNSGGSLVIKNSQFDHNEDGFDTNSQEGDNPPPQDGACAHNGTSSITHTHSCWVFMDNYVHDNNTPNVPTAGLAGGGPVGTGMSISGGRNDTVMHNRFVHNGAWGNVIVPFPGSGSPCTGGQATPPDDTTCIWDAYGIAVLGNSYSRNGYFGNPTNGDFAVTSLYPDPTDCFAGNKDGAGLTATPTNAEQMYPKCNGQTVPPFVTNPQSAQFTEEVACDSTLALPAAGKAPCAPTDHYPRVNFKKIHNGLHPLPARRRLPTMPSPCRGVPRNPWCPGHGGSKRQGVRRNQARAERGFTG